MTGIAHRVTREAFAAGRRARLVRSSGTAYALMGGTEEATRHLAEANDGWEPRDSFERANADLSTAAIQRDLG